MYEPKTLEEALQALRDSEARLRAILDAAQEGLTISVNGVVCAVNRAACVLVGRDEHEILGHPVTELVSPAAGDRVMTAIARGEVEPYEVEIKHADGSSIPVEVLGCNTFWDGQPARATSVRDLRPGREAERELRASEARFRELADFLPVMVGEADARGCFVFFNRTGLESLGYDSDAEVLGRSVLDLVAPHDRERATANLRRRLAGEDLGPQQYTDVRRDGTTFPALHYIGLVERDGQVVGVRTAVIDLTERVEAEEERRRLQTQMLRTQKLESLGVLAGGIAHDFNNVLATVVGNAEVALLELTPNAPERVSLNRIKQAAIRASELVSELLAYAGKGQGQVGELDLNELVLEMSDLLGVSTAKRAIVEHVLQRPLPSVSGDATQLRQVVMNLVTNAAEALGTDGGLIRLTTSTRDSPEAVREELALGRSPLVGSFVCLEVTDTGCGMESDTLVRIFEPFFSTKFTGRGLGLAAVLGIVRSHRGAVHVRSELGVGTRFRMLLPASAPVRSPSALEPQAAAPAPTGARGPRWRGRGRVLVVDDDEMLLDATRAMLVHLGLEVVTASGGRAALAQLEAKVPFDLVLLDSTMATMSGRRVFDELRARRSQIPVLLISGFEESEAIAAFGGADLAGFLHKPFRLESLIEALEPLLPSA